MWENHVLLAPCVATFGRPIRLCNLLAFLPLVWAELACLRSHWADLTGFDALRLAALGKDLLEQRPQQSLNFLQSKVEIVGGRAADHERWESEISADLEPAPHLVPAEAVQNSSLEVKTVAETPWRQTGSEVVDALQTSPMQALTRVAGKTSWFTYCQKLLLRPHEVISTRCTFLFVAAFGSACLLWLQGGLQSLGPRRSSKAASTDAADQWYEEFVQENSSALPLQARSDRLFLIPAVRLLASGRQQEPIRIQGPSGVGDYFLVVSEDAGATRVQVTKGEPADANVLITIEGIPKGDNEASVFRTSTGFLGVLREVACRKWALMHNDQERLTVLAEPNFTWMVEAQLHGERPPHRTRALAWAALKRGVGDCQRQGRNSDFLEIVIMKGCEAPLPLACTVASVLASPMFASIPKASPNLVVADEELSVAKPEKQAS